MLSVASCHAACVTDDGVVWVWGTDMHGGMGLDDKNTKYFPQQWPETHCGGAPVQMVACGPNLTLALTRNGDVWACGSGKFCQNGSREHADLSVPARVPGLPCIVMVAAGKEHAAAVDFAGEVWTWGKVSQSCWSDEPVCVGAAAFAGEAVVLVSTGYGAVAAVTALGALWMWGSGSHGQLGAGHLDDLAAPSLVCGGAAPAWGGSRVLMASCGEHQTMAVTEAGAVFMWGFGWFNRLGQRDPCDRHVPTRVDAPAFGNGVRIVSGCVGWGPTSMALSDEGVLYSWGGGIMSCTPCPVAARVGRACALPRLHALAFCMGSHKRLGGGDPRQGRAAAPCPYERLPDDVLRRVVERLRVPAGAHADMGEGLLRLLAVRTLVH